MRRSQAIPQRSGPGSLGRLPTLALTALVVGAAASATMTLYAIRHNPSTLLMTLFTTWVLGPFIFLGLAHVVSTHWSILTRRALYVLMLLVTVASLIVYGQRILRAPRATGAFVFVALPPLLVLTVLIVVIIVGLISGRKAPAISGE